MQRGYPPKRAARNITEDRIDMTANPQKRRRSLLPGCHCPQCGAVARSVHLRYVANDQPIKIPIRTFECGNCNGKRKDKPPFRFQREATDLMPTSVIAS